MRFFSGYFGLGLAGYDFWAHSTSSPVLGETIRSLHGLHSDRFFVAGYPENTCAMNPKDNTPNKAERFGVSGKRQKTRLCTASGHSLVTIGLLLRPG